MEEVPGEEAPIIQAEAAQGLLGKLKRFLGFSKQSPQPDAGKAVDPKAAAPKTVVALAQDAASGDQAKPAATGLASRVAMDPFVAAAKDIAARWGDFNNGNSRAQALIAAANAQLAAAQVPECRPKVLDLPPGVQGRFDWEPWDLEMSKPLFEKDKMSNEDAASVSSIVYHEARHAEQLFNVARLLAGQNKTPDDIRKTTRIDAAVITLALARPLGTHEPEAAAAEAHLGSLFVGPTTGARDTLLQNLLSATEVLVSAKLEHQRIFGENAPAPERRAANDLLNDAKRKMSVFAKQYKALPEEADAFDVQAEIERLFLFPNG